MTATHEVGSTQVRDIEAAPKRYVRLALAIIAVFLTPVLYLLYVIHYAVNSLFLDDWASVAVGDATLHGRLAWTLLWQQHNENRFLLPNLSFAFFTALGHLNTKTIVVFSAVLMVAAYLLLIRLYRQERDSSRSLVAVVIIGLVWFSPVDYENALWAFQDAWYIILLLFIVMLVALSTNRLTKSGLAVALLAAVGASFSSFQGLLLWPVGLLCIVWRLGRNDRQLGFVGAWVATTAVTCAAYFRNFDFGKATGGTGFSYDIHHFNQLIRYFIADVGNVFPANTFDSATFRMHELAGIGLLVAASVVLFDIIRSRWRVHAQEPFPVAGSLIVFGLLFSASVALGTLWYGMIAAVHTSRFTMPNIILLLGIGLYALSKAHHLRSSRTPLAGATGVVQLAALALVGLAVATQIGVGTRFGLVNGRQDRADRVVASIIAVNYQFMPKRTAAGLVTEYVYPYYPQFLKLVDVARRDGLGEFAPSEFHYYLHRKLPMPLPPPQEG